MSAVVKQDFYPVPRIDECIDSLGEAAAYASSGCWQAEFEEIDYGRTLLKSHHGLYKFVRIHFGLNNAPGLFQWAISVMLSLVKRLFTLIYIDDIAVFLRSPKNRINHVKQVLSLLRYAEVTIKEIKCNFFTRTIDYLGYVTHLRHLEIAVHTTAAIK